ncbi:MAG: pentapeptide repeat-containing protein [SAR324 cluster bacterium]|nr:pentapeptide repeat-containing protein [SAR324 cluster bacterium]
MGGADLRGAKLDRAFMNEAILCNTIMPDGRIEYSGCLLPTLKQLLNAFEQR